jgi:RsiW-degrading membrane proteinase PrsW (M82 family)
MDYSIIVYIVFGILPSLIWLLYYLTKDLHPEPKRMIIKIFLLGAFITLPVFFVQVGLTNLLAFLKINPPSTLYSILYWFLVISFSEEFLKYLVVRIKVVDNPCLDEPLDIMLYMVVSALGFATVENILYLFTPVGDMSLSQLINRTLMVDLIRFVGATFLHTLCSAAIGYSMAIAFLKMKSRRLLVFLGILMGVVLHGLYDFSIMTLDGNAKFIVPGTLIVILAILVFWGFAVLRNMKSICEVKLKKIKK